MGDPSHSVQGLQLLHGSLLLQHRLQEFCVVGFSLAQCDTPGGAGIHVDMHEGVSDILVHHENPVGAGQVLSKPLDIFLELSIEL